MEIAKISSVKTRIRSPKTKRLITVNGEAYKKLTHLYRESDLKLLILNPNLKIEPIQHTIYNLLPKEIWTEIINQTAPLSLLQLCQTSKELYKLCQANIYYQSVVKNLEINTFAISNQRTIFTSDDYIYEKGYDNIVGGDLKHPNKYGKIVSIKSAGNRVFFIAIKNNQSKLYGYTCPMIGKATLLKDNVLSIHCAKYYFLILTLEGLYYYGREHFENKSKIPLDDIMSVSCNDSHAIILTKQGLYGFGNTMWGQLGIKSDDVKLTKLKINLNVIQVSCGSYHTLLLTDKGEVYAMGSNQYHQLGVEYIKKSYKPVKVDIPKAVSIYCGENYNIVILENKTIWGFGENCYGQLGLHWVKSILPTKLPFENIDEISIKHNITLIRIKNTIYGMGDNSYEQLDKKGIVGEPIKINLKI